jgi:tetratricopeptide (TPR) repeat protein
LLRLADDPELERRGPVGLWLLGHSLEMTGSHGRALEVLRRARRTYPGDYWLNVELGLASLEGVRSGLGATSTWYTTEGSSDLRFQRAEPYFMAAVALRPRSGPAHLLLASAMLNQGKWDETFAEFREALRLQPDDSTTHNSLGMAYSMRGEPDRADAEFREALRLQPGYVLARGNLGDLLLSRGRPEEAADIYRGTIRLQPKFAPAHAQLARALATQHQPEAAAASYREAIRLAPQFVQAYAALGGVLRQIGDFAGAAAALRTAFEIQPDPQWQAAMRLELARTERWAGMAPRLPGVLGGADRPRDAAEALEFADLARGRLEFAGAARLFAMAFRLEPRLADDLGQANRYNAACCAVLAAAGRSRGEPHPAATAAAESRRTALEWLRLDLAARSVVLRDGQAAEKAQLLQALGYWKADPDLADVRSADALGRLPEPEGRGWRALWAEVDSLIDSLKTGPGGAPSPPSR